MRTTDTRVLNWRRPIPHEDPATARLLAICTALCAEITVLRERLDTHERLAAERGLYSTADVEAYEPGPEAVAERDALRSRQIARVFRALKEDAEREARAAAARAQRAAGKAAKVAEAL